MISFEDFQNVDIRVGTVVEASVPEWSHWVMRIKVDLGNYKLNVKYLQYSHYIKRGVGEFLQ